MPLAILGSGGFAREVATIIHAINAKSPTYDLIGYIDNRLAKGTLINGLPVIGSDDEINKTSIPISIVTAFGEPDLKEKVYNKYTNPLISFPSIIHPSVILGDTPSIKLGKGCIICANCILTTNIEIKDFVTLNLSCTVGHDVTIGNFSSFMPSCNISGEESVLRHRCENNQSNQCRRKCHHRCRCCNYTRYSCKLHSSWHSCKTYKI